MFIYSWARRLSAVISAPFILAKMVNNPWICRAENYNTSAIELLRRLPGVTDANYRSLMDECKSLAEVALLPAERLAEVMGGKQPARMLRDFLDAKCPILA